MAAPSFHGVVLAGGASRRMGEDKAFLHVDGQPLIQRALDALAGADERMVIGGDANRIGSLGVRHLADDEPGAGPAPAIAAALASSTSPLTVILPCDLPHITADAVSRLVASIGEGDCAVPLIDGRVAWLPSVWRTSLEPTIRHRIGEGVRSVRRIGSSVRLVHFVDTDPQLWRDADRPEDLPAPPFDQVR